MDELQLHLKGANDHLKELTKKFQNIIERIKGNDNLTEKEKQIELKKAKDDFSEEKQQVDNKLF